jgi:hypothetical protein
VVVGRDDLAVLKIAGRPLGGSQGGEEKILTTRVGLLFPSLLTFTRWQQAGQRIHRLHDSSSWCLGDWLVYGQREYVGRYQKAVEMAGLDYQTLRNYAWVARSFTMVRRREKLSFQHHAEVASLSPQEQDRWLDLTEANRWSRNELRRNVREARNGGEVSAGKKRPFPRLSVSDDRVRNWSRAAEQSSLSLEEWIVDSLDQVAGVVGPEQARSSA